MSFWDAAISIGTNVIGGLLGGGSSSGGGGGGGQGVAAPPPPDLRSHMLQPDRASMGEVKSAASNRGIEEYIIDDPLDWLSDLAGMFTRDEKKT